MADVLIEQNVRAGESGLLVDVFRPAVTDGPSPALLFLPGGSWRTKNRADMKDRYGIKMAERGVVCIAGEYRVMSEAPWPAPIHDVKTIIRWIRSSADRFGVDPGRISAGGSSAGGHLALLAAGTPDSADLEPPCFENVSSAVVAAIGIYPVCDMVVTAEKNDLSELFPGGVTEEALLAASPISHVHPEYPPTLLVHGTGDVRVDYRRTVRMYDALEAAGVPVDLQLYSGQDHVFDREDMYSGPIADAMALFIQRYAPAAAIRSGAAADSLRRQIRSRIPGG
ncbi:MAG: alpha/beta hydrolase [Dehalococcoidia bacterium]|nr:alpha/beta hydrolase [Dehalococcoidia bacterium]